MSVKEFDKAFGLSSSIDEEKIKFINRIENSIFSAVMRSSDYESLFRKVCYEVGENAEDLISRVNPFSIGSRSLPTLNSLSQKDFVKTLRVVVAIYNSYLENLYFKNMISKVINEALEKSPLTLGIRWKDGVFYPTGDKLLDENLIDESFSLLSTYPNEKKDLKNALDNYSAGSLYGVVENCYIAVEGISRQMLNNNKTLDNNQTDLLKLLQFSAYWDKIFLNYLKYAHEYRRHAGQNRHQLKPSEVEGFLYLTCLVIRATIRTHLGLNNSSLSQV